MTGRKSLAVPIVQLAIFGDDVGWIGDNAVIGSRLEQRSHGLQVFAGISVRVEFLVRGSFGKSIRFWPVEVRFSPCSKESPQATLI